MRAVWGRSGSWASAVLTGTLLACLLGAASAAAAVQPFEVQGYSQDLGVSAAVAEQHLETQGRGTTADIVGQLERRLGDRYAGVWFDNETGEFVVPLPPGVGQAGVDTLFTADGLAGDFRTVPARSSWRELEAAQERMSEALGKFLGAGLVETSLDPRGNAVVIDRAEGTSEADRQRIEDLAEKESVDIQVRAKKVNRFKVASLSCNAFAHICGTPLRGGVGIGSAEGVGPSCTAAFKLYGDVVADRFMLTAGHCESAENHSTWYSENSSGKRMTIGPMEAWNHSPGDWAKINADGSEWDKASPWPSLIAYWSNNPPVGENQEYPIYGEASSYLEEWVCHSGLTSGTSCGFVTALNVSVPLPDGGREHLTEVSPICAEQGDSGGPVFAANTALGIASAGDLEITDCTNRLFYANVTEADAAMGTHVALDTETFSTVTQTLNGQPGYASVNGHVYSGSASLNGTFVNVNFQKLEGGVWVTKSSAHPTITSNYYEVSNWGVGVGQWRVRTVFPAQNPYEQSESGYHEFTIKSGYHLVARHSGKCAAVSENSKVNGASIVQWACNSNPSPGDGQVFTLVPQSPENYEIMANSSGKCMNVSGASKTNGAKVIQWTCEPVSNGIWHYVALSGGNAGYVSFTANHSGQCLNVSGSSTSNGAQIIQWPCSGGFNEMWSLQVVG